MFRWIKENAQGLLAVGTVVIAFVAVVGVAAGAWQALDSKAEKAADRIEAKLDAAIQEMREERRQDRAELQALREEWREDRRIWIEQLNRVNDQLIDMNGRVSTLGG